MESPGISTTPTSQNSLLQIIAGPAAGTLIRVGSDFRIGRSECGEGALGSDPELSRHHATLRRSADGVLTIEDAGSTNGTYVNGGRISGPRVLRPGDTVCVGATTLQVAAPPHPVGGEPPTLVSVPTGSGQQRQDPAAAADQPPSPGAMTGPPEDRARQLFEAGDLDASLAVYRELIAARVRLGPSYQSAGYICLLRKDYAEAGRLLEASLEVNPANANALYLRGQVAAVTGDAAAARSYYERALAVDPEHARARQGLVLLTRAQHAAPSQPQPPASAPPTYTGPPPARGGPAAASWQLGVYEYLLQDNSSLSRQAVELIELLSVSRHPRVTAFLGRRSRQKKSKWPNAVIALLIIVWAVFVASRVPWVRDHDGTFSPVPAPVAVLVSVLLIGIPLLLYLVYAATIRYTISRGRITLESGLFTRDVKSTELWRVKLVELHQSIPNRLFGDGTLIFTLNDDKSEVLVTGLASISELRRTREQLMNLIFALRSNTMIKGIVQ